MSDFLRNPHFSSLPSQSIIIGGNKIVTTDSHAFVSAPMLLLILKLSRRRRTFVQSNIWCKNSRLSGIHTMRFARLFRGTLSIVLHVHFSGIKNVHVGSLVVFAFGKIDLVGAADLFGAIFWDQKVS